MEPARPPTAWEARVAQAKRDGGWYVPDEEPSPYPPAVRRKRFWTGFALTLVVFVVANSLLDLALHRPGPAFGPGELLDGAVTGLFPALYVGWLLTRAPRRQQRPPSAAADPPPADAGPTEP